MKEVSKNLGNLKSIEENIFISIILTFIGGFLDSYTFVLYDKVFANTQTGNLIYFSISLLQKDFSKTVYHFLPILFFALAIFITQLLLYKFVKNKNWIKIVVGINIILTLLIGFGFFKDYKIVIICLIAFICASLIGTFKKSMGNIFAPTMCTGNLRFLVEYFSRWVIYKKEEDLKVTLNYLYIILSFALGVIIGVILVNYLRTYSILICTILFLLIYIIINLKNIDL